MSMIIDEKGLDEKHIISRDMSGCHVSVYFLEKADHHIKDVERLLFAAFERRLENDRSIFSDCS